MWEWLQLTQVIGYIPYECWLGATMTFEFFAFNRKLPAYPEFGDATLKCALWTFKQQLALKIRVHYGISIVLLQTSLYCAFRDTKWQCVINGFTGVKKDYLQWDSTWWSLDQESNIYLSGLTWHVLVRGILKLTFVHVPLHFLDLDDSPRIKRAWLYKDLKVSDLKAHARLTHLDRR